MSRLSVLCYCCCCCCCWCCLLVRRCSCVYFWLFSFFPTSLFSMCSLCCYCCWIDAFCSNFRRKIDKRMFVQEKRNFYQSQNKLSAKCCFRRHQLQLFHSTRIYVQLFVVQVPSSLYDNNTLSLSRALNPLTRDDKSNIEVLIVNRTRDKWWVQDNNIQSNNFIAKMFVNTKRQCLIANNNYLGP